METAGEQTRRPILGPDYNRREYVNVKSECCRQSHAGRREKFGRRDVVVCQIAEPHTARREIQLDRAIELQCGLP